MRKLKNEELNRDSITAFKKAKKIPLVLILDNIRSLNNIGSVFRTADAFRIEKIYLCGITAQPPHKDIHKTALGATESVAWEYISKAEELLQKLQQEGVELYAIEQTEGAQTLQNFEPKAAKKYGFILGNEVQGVQQHLIDIANKALEIPQWGTKHSLNISVATGIALWDFITKWQQHSSVWVAIENGGDYF